jgi:glycosyltransferase involved in cell wall biosynthesis
MLNKRVLFVIDSLESGGAEQVFADIVELLYGHVSFDVLLIQPKRDEAYDLPKEVTIMYLNRINKWSFQSFFKCRAIVKKYDIVHVHMRHTYRYIATISKSVLRSPKLILHDHYGLINIDKSQPFYFSKWLEPDIYIGVCNELCDWASQIWSMESNRNFALINLPSRRFLGRNCKSEVFEEKGDLVMVGNIKKTKNQFFALEVCHALSRHLTLIGKNQDAQYALDLKNSHLAKDVEFQEDITDVTTILGNYKMAVFTSISESGPLVIIEYLLCGIPFLAYKTGGTADVVSHYFPEYFIDNFSVLEWVKRINEIENKHRHISIEKVKLMIEVEFNIENYRNALLAIYEA